MREFVVTLRSGHRVTVRADRVVTPEYQPDGYVRLVADGGPAAGEPKPEVVALFEARTVLAVVARDHLVGEERVEPVHVVGGLDDDIPF